MRLAAGLGNLPIGEIGRDRERRFAPKQTLGRFVQDLDLGRHESLPIVRVTKGANARWLNEPLPGPVKVHEGNSLADSLALGFRGASIDGEGDLGYLTLSRVGRVDPLDHCCQAPAAFL